MATEQEFNQSNWSSSLNESREKKLFTDIVFICSDGELEAHRVVLSIRSSYFKQMFLSDFKESITKQVDYSHIDKNIMQLILDFIYLNSLENVSELSYSDLLLLYKTSHMFELKRLREYSWTLVLININVENWLDIWNIVVFERDESEIHKVLRFIMKNLHEITKQGEFLSLSLSQITNFLEKINKFKFATEDHLLEAVIRWSEKQIDQKSVQNLLLFFNFDFISKEYMDTIIESDKGLFKDEAFEQFFKKQIVPRLKTKTEVEDHFKAYNPTIKVYPKVSFQFFLFCCYFKKNNGDFLYHKAGLRIFDLKSEKVKLIDNLPFHLRDGITSVQCDSQIYVIGGLLNTAPNPKNTSNLTKSFFRYDWETNTATELPPLPKAVTKDCHVCVVEDDIFVIQNDDFVKNAIFYFSINKSKWCVIANSLPTVIACVELKDDLYLLCWDLKIYTLYKLNNSACTFYCSVPVEPKAENYFSGTNDAWQTRYVNTIYRKLVTFYKDEIFILCDKNFFSFTLNPEIKTWKMGKINFKFDSLTNYRCINVENRVLMFYNEISHKLYKYDEKTADLKEIKTIRGSLEDDQNLYKLGFSKFESMLVFAKKIII